ncbi:hypothetical protein [Simkania negevensis]|uniref:Uncharacterized protein n=1 Tax=Simkania negevensis (strain ATCC VR-1471 / DSM 27360 / Z) TaxID=331113 RepID=F8L5F1_SIMNZ|nr:hypothetical protein [Simkania negevensis]CCB89263.1 unknown protein [Simkania negevensis Z]
MIAIHEINPHSFFQQVGHLALETYALVVRSAIKGMIETLALGSIFYLGQRFILRADMNTATPFEISTMIACNHFVDNLFQPLQDEVLQIKKPTYEQLRKEVVYFSDLSWKKEALEVLIYAATFFPKAYLSFKVADYVGCLSETIEANKNSLKLTFYLFTALRLFHYSRRHFRNLVDTYRHPKAEIEPIFYLPT